MDKMPCLWGVRTEWDSNPQPDDYKSRAYSDLFTILKAKGTESLNLLFFFFFFFGGGGGRDK